MNRERREKFKRAGWRIGTVGELLGLTPAEEALIEAKVRLSKVVRSLRKQSRLSQAELAKRIGSNQTRIAKVENQDPEVSLDLQMKAIFAARPEARQEFSALIRSWATPNGRDLEHHGRSGRRRRPVAA
jgi:DNA-binding XRE family transcriptional regulator